MQAQHRLELIELAGPETFIITSNLHPAKRDVEQFTKRNLTQSFASSLTQSLAIIIKPKTQLWRLSWPPLLAINIIV